MKAIGPLRSFTKVAGAMIGVVAKPYSFYQHDKGLVKGVGEGLFNLYNAVTEETSYLASMVSIIINFIPCVDVGKRN